MIEEYKVVVVSTGHMRQSDTGALDLLARSKDCNMVMARDTGYFVMLYCSPSNHYPPEQVVEQCSEEIINVLRWAGHSGYQMVEFDCDADHLPWFPTFEW